MLANALAGIEGAKWLGALGDLLVLLERMLDVCDKSDRKPKLMLAHFERMSGIHSTRPKSARKSRAHNENGMRRAKSMSELANDVDGVASPPPAPASPLPSDHDWPRLSDISPTDDVASPSRHSRHGWTPKGLSRLRTSNKRVPTPPRQAATPPSESKETPQHRHKAHFKKTSTSPLDLDGITMEPCTPDENPSDVTSNRDLPSAYKEALTSVITAMAALNLPLFLHCFGNRLLIESMAGPQSALTCISAISSLLRHRDDRRKVVQELPLLASVLMKAMAPGHHSLKRSCQQGVIALLSELCNQFPMIETNRVTDVLAVGNYVSPAIQLSPRHKSDATTALEAIAIYDLSTGIKRKSLSIGKALQKTAQHLRAAAAGGDAVGDDASGIGIAALCFRKDGEVCAAYCPAATLLCIWDLHVSWGQKLSRGPVVIEPVKIVQLGPDVPGLQPVATSHLDLTYKLSWQETNQVAVLHGSQQLALIELHLGT